MDKRYPAEGHPWADFLHYRLRLIHAWADEGKSAGEILESLRMDVGQVVLLMMTPLEHPPAAPPVPVEAGEGEKRRTCEDCGASLNAGEAKCFTVCDTCWGKTYMAPVPPPEQKR